LLKDLSSDEKKIVGAITEDETVEYCKKLIRIPSVFGSEHEIAEAISRDLEGHGFKVTRVPVDGAGPSVIGVLTGKERPRLIFNGHMDTVQVCEGWTKNPFDPVADGNRLYGLGSVDMKGGVAAFLVAANALKTVPLKHEFADYAVSDEECWSRGTTTLINQGYYQDAAYCIVAEPSNLNRLRNARRGQCLVDVTVRGRSTHAAQPQNGLNAITEAAKVITALASFPEKTHPRILDFRLQPLSTSSCVLKIDGGSDALSVPERCVIRLDRHVNPGTTIQDGLEEIKAYLKQNLEGSTFNRLAIDYTPRPGVPYEAYETNPNSELVKTLLAVSSCFGYDPPLIGGASVADDCLIAARCGIPVVSYGPGAELDTHASGGAHEKDEYVDWRQVVDAARIYAVTAYRILNHN
jgi:acetylornithine deacetylase/succinyl-diaminopimelate desuccinylase family protein